jgi:hypothetical protein
MTPERPVDPAQFHAPRRGPDGWVYSCAYGDQARPIGYCSPACRHLTAEDAERHYRRYLVDAAEFGGYWPGKQYQCEVCGAWTDRYVVVKSCERYPLCQAHQDRQGLTLLLPV